MQVYKTQNLPEQKSHSNKRRTQYQTVLMTDGILNKNPRNSCYATFLLFFSTTKLGKKVSQISDVIKREITLAGAQILRETKHRRS